MNGTESTSAAVIAVFHTIRMRRPNTPNSIDMRLVMMSIQLKMDVIMLGPRAWSSGPSHASTAASGATATITTSMSMKTTANGIRMNVVTSILNKVLARKSMSTAIGFAKNHAPFPMMASDRRLRSSIGPSNSHERSERVFVQVHVVQYVECVFVAEHDLHATVGNRNSQNLSRHVGQIPYRDR